MRISALAALAVATGVCVSHPVAAAAAPAGTAPANDAPANDAVSGLVGSVLWPDAVPAGANDWTCVPDSQHPRPVVLIHGTSSSRYSVWQRLSWMLKQEGWCVFALNYGGQPASPFKGVAHVPDSANELGSFVDLVLTATGAEQVDFVGHSQGGGVLPRWYLAFDPRSVHPDGRPKVANLIGITPSNHGISAAGTSSVGMMDVLGVVFGPAWQDQAPDSDVVRALDAAGDTVPGVKYTNIFTGLDLIATPVDNQDLNAGSGDVNNINLQDVCPLDLSDHIGATYSPVITQVVFNALDPQNAVAPDCVLTLPVLR